MLNALKLNLNAFITLKAYATNYNGEKATAIAILVVINLVPIIIARLLFKKKNELEDEAIWSRYNTIYKGKQVNKEKNHHVWLYPIAFFYRRTIFICAMVYLLDWPYLQMMIHEVLTLATIVYLIRDKQRYEEKIIRLTEVGSEVLLLFTSILIQEFMRNNVASVNTSMTLTVLVFTFISILALINIFGML